MQTAVLTEVRMRFQPAGQGREVGREFWAHDVYTIYNGAHNYIHIKHLKNKYTI